ncbi:Uncharacterised protein [Bacillus freudenreichii]|nr:Uncharacterised protein [Bacillus freudenreichii]
MEKKEKSNSKKPLLYIAQPNFQEPKYQMQNEYNTNTDKPVASHRRERVAPVEQSNVKKGSSNFNEEEEFIFQSEEKQTEEIQVEEQAPISAADYFRHHTQYSEPTRGRLTPVKSFIAMTIEEKLHHLSTKSQFYSCTFTTAANRVIGKLHAVQEDAIVVKTESGKYFTIEKKELKAIRING